MNHILDVTKEHCPMTFVKVKIRLATMNLGERLEVIMEGGEPLANIPRSAAEQGHRVIETTERNGHFHVVIEKAL